MRICRLFRCFVLAATVVAAVVWTSAATRASCIAAKSTGAEKHRIYGQLVMVGFTGQFASDAGVQEARRDLFEGYAGGLVFFRRNVESAIQLRTLTDDLKENLEYPPFLAIDEEGGRVERLTHRNGFTKQPSAAVLAARGPEMARQSYDLMARELAAAGLNFNLGPVVDLNLRKTNPIIGSLDRAYSDDPEVVVKYAQVFVDAHRAHGIVTALKHFPGHGSSRQDSHDTVVDVTGDWQKVELSPYRQLIHGDYADAVMITHLINRAHWSPQNLPATLSAKAVALLRDELRFEGVVLSDDLQMQAIAKDFPLARAIVQALAAGNDMVLIGNVLEQQPDVARFAVKAIETAVENGELEFAKLEQSFCRIVQLKEKLAPTYRMDTP